MWAKPHQTLFICSPEQTTHQEVQVVYANNLQHCKEKLIKWGHDITDWKFSQVTMRGYYGKVVDLSQVEYGEVK